MGYDACDPESMRKNTGGGQGLASGSGGGQELGGDYVINCRYESSKISSLRCTTAAVLPGHPGAGKTYAVKTGIFGGRSPTSYCCASAQRVFRHPAGPRQGQILGRFNSWSRHHCEQRDAVGSRPLRRTSRDLPCCRCFPASALAEAASWSCNYKRCVSNNIMLVGSEGAGVDCRGAAERMDQVCIPGENLNPLTILWWMRTLDTFPEQLKVRDARLMGCLPDGGAISCLISWSVKDHEYWQRLSAAIPFAGGPSGPMSAGAHGGLHGVDFAENTAYVAQAPPCVVIYPINCKVQSENQKGVLGMLHLSFY